MHHLILLRENDQQVAASGCCGRLTRQDLIWSDCGEAPAEHAPAMARFGALYRTVREAFGSEVEITVLDPRNVVSFYALVLRDAFRYRVPVGTALRSLVAVSFATGILDGQLIFSGTAPPPEELVAIIAGRLRIDRVGAA